MRKLLTLFSLILLGQTLQASGLPVVPYVDLQRYMGRWYEIARYENSFQEKCLASRATYSLKDEKVSVLNECVNRKTNEVDQAHGTAFVVDEKTNAKLKVSFVPFVQRWGWFAGDYWIHYLDDEYKHVIVGHPERKFFWILARSPTISTEQYIDLLEIAKDLGYDVSKINRSMAWK